MNCWGDLEEQEPISPDWQIPDVNQTNPNPVLIQVCYPVANGVLWCNAVHRKGVLRANPSGKGYKFPCPWARLVKKPLKKGESKIATPLEEVAILQTSKD